MAGSPLLYGGCGCGGYGEGTEDHPAAISMELASKLEKPVIFAVGNAPTALIQIYELMQERDWRPAFVIGVPVGFVNVEAAKELIIETDVPYIINRGRKGGSNVAAAICNALLYELRKEQENVTPGD